MSMLGTVLLFWTIASVVLGVFVIGRLFQYSDQEVTARRTKPTGRYPLLSDRPNGEHADNPPDQLAA